MVSNCVRPRTKRARGHFCAFVCVDAHLAEIVPEALLEEVTRFETEWLPR
jgi:hypothetical protein